MDQSDNPHLPKAETLRPAQQCIYCKGLYHYGDDHNCEEKKRNYQLREQYINDKKEKHSNNFKLNLMKVDQIHCKNIEKMNMELSNLIKIEFDKIVN